MQFGVSKSSQTVIDLSDIQPVPTPQIYDLPKGKVLVDTQFSPYLPKGFTGPCSRYAIQFVPT